MWTRKKLLCLCLLTVAIGLTPQVWAQASAGPTALVKVDDFGLKDRLMPTKYRSLLKLSTTQLSSVKSLDTTWQKTLDRLSEEGKTLSHEHADGEECPACVHAEKVQAAYKSYYRGLGSVLNTTQKGLLRSLVKKEKAAKG